MRDGFKEKIADKDSIQERIRAASRSHGAEEAIRIRENLLREKNILHRGVWQAQGLGINPFP